MPWFLSGWHSGMIMTMLGLAFLGLTVVANRRNYLVAGVVLLALGVGSLASAMINHRLSKTRAQNKELGSGPTNAPIG